MGEHDTDIAEVLFTVSLAGLSLAGCKQMAVFVIETGPTDSHACKQDPLWPYLAAGQDESNPVQHMAVPRCLWGLQAGAAAAAKGEPCAAFQQSCLAWRGHQRLFACWVPSLELALTSPALHTCRAGNQGPLLSPCGMAIKT